MKSTAVSAEIYLPPRSTLVVSEICLRAAWSLDLTTVDPVDAQPWDFSFEVKRKRAVELLERAVQRSAELHCQG